ncbi:MAG: hypothetical protein MUO31_16325 [Thermodesulfovibrionales bacterium]|nr:hypothetical protein [Thermodesulfovibrionales bacterium]
MGIFSNLFPIGNIEKRLEKIYVPSYQSMGMSLSEAESTFKDILKDCKEDAEKDETTNLPENFGDVLLEKEKTNESIKNLHNRKRKEGVTNQDIRWWWNMHDLERRMMIYDDNWTRTTAFLNNINNKKMSQDEAADAVKKHYFLYGEPDLKKNSIEEDDPLPFELKDRINIYYSKRAGRGFQEFLDEIQTYTSINAFIRNEIKNGNL